MTTINNIQTAIDTNGRQLVYILDTTSSHSTQEDYKFYSGTLDAGTSPLVIDALTDLGRYSISGFVYNNSLNDFTMAFSSDGTNYGDDITIKAGSTFSYPSGSYWFKYTKIKLTKGAGGDSDYQVFIL